METTEHFTFDFVTDVHKLSAEWDQHCEDNIFLQKGFLSILQDSPLQSIEQHYVCIRQQEKLVGIALLQVKHFQLKDSLRLQDHPKSILAKASLYIKSTLAGLVNYKVLVIGNLLLTGNYGYKFNGVNSGKDTLTLLNKISDFGVKALKNNGVKIAGILLKDYDDQLKLDTNSIEGKRYVEFKVQPGMHLEIRPHWDTMDAYMADMKSKYRVRIKNALKAVASINKKILNLEEIKSLESDIHRLYSCVSEGAGFNMFLLKSDYFYELKRKLGNKVEIIGYFLEGKLIGFYSAIENHGHLDAHFLGYDPDYNRSHKLYMNMLIGLTSYAIDRKMECIQMSRTAMEIKSSVGAISTEYYLYLNAQNRFYNFLCDRLLTYFTPEDAWKARHPFK